MFGKRGLSTIVSTLLILLLVFVAIGILWVVIRNVVQSGSEQISLGKFTLDLKIDQVQISESINQISVKVKRNSGDGEFVGMKFIFSDGDNTEIFDRNLSLKVNEKKTYDFILLNINVSEIESVSIAPIFLLSSGKESVGDIKDSWERGSEGISSTEEIITPGENETGGECTFDVNCTQDYNSTDFCSGNSVYKNFYDFSCNTSNLCDYNTNLVLIQSCNSTQTCSNGDCVNISCAGSSTQSCQITNGVGQQTRTCTSGVWSSWGTCTVVSCNSGYTISGNGCVVSESNEDFVIIFSQNFNDDTVGDYSYSAWLEDWGMSTNDWVEPCNRDCSNPALWAEAGLSIVSENNNKFMRLRIDEKGLANSGIQWQKTFSDQKELYVSYKVRFDDEMDRLCQTSGQCIVGSEGGYQGKLPGFCAGGCTGGGMPPHNYNNWSMRLMFHGTSSLNFYMYHINMLTQYGESLMFSPYDPSPKEWFTITERLVMNTPGQKNGIVEGYINGVLVAQRTNMEFIDSATSTQGIEKLYFQVFLGGSGEDPKIYGEILDFDFDDVVIYKYADGVPGIPTGNTPSPPTRTLELPSV